MRALIVVVKSDSSSAVGFPDFLEEMVMYHSKLTVLRCASGTIATCPVFQKKQVKCFMREQLLLDLAHLETPIQSTAVYFRAHTRKSMIHHLSRCHRRVSKHRDHIFGAFLWTNWNEFFFERLTYWRTVSMVSDTTTDFGRPSRNSSWSHHSIDKH